MGKIYACLDCAKPTPHRRCTVHASQHKQRVKENEQARGSAAQRGYNSKWRRNRARFLKANPTCLDCGQPATVADHAPTTRKQLVTQGVKHPDAWEHLQPRCEGCHNSRTARTKGDQALWQPQR